MKKLVPIAWWLLTVAAVAGGCYLALGPMTTARLSRDWSPHVGHGLGALVAGILAGWRAPRQTLAEVGLAAAGFIGLMVALTLVPAHPWFIWLPARSGEPVRDVAVLGAIVMGGAMGGAWLGRRLHRQETAMAALALFCVVAGLGGLWLLSLTNDLVSGRG